MAPWDTEENEIGRSPPKSELRLFAEYNVRLPKSSIWYIDVMKCVFCLSGDNPEYTEMASVAVLSAKENTDLELLFVYDGSNIEYVKWLEKNNVLVLKWTITFLGELSGIYDGEKSIEFCRGTYLCMELPYILKQYGIDDEYVLYADIDSMFVGDVDLDKIMPKLFAAPRDWSVTDNSRFSTGILLMNCKSLLDTYPSFLDHLRSKRYNFAYAEMGPCDQGAWNTFFKKQYDELSNIYDWKPWWGLNKSARILHFSGPKPRHIRRLLQSSNLMTNDDKIHKYVVDQDPEAYLEYLNTWEVIANRTR